MPYDIGLRLQEQGYLPSPIVSQTSFERFFGMAPGSWIPGTMIATPRDIEIIKNTSEMVALGMGQGVGASTGMISKAIGSSMVLGGTGLALAGQEVRAVGLPGILGKVFSGIGRVAKGFLGLGGGAVAAGVGGAAVGAIGASALKGGKHKRHHHRAGLSAKELKDLMMMKAVMGPGCVKSPAFQLAMMKRMG